MISLLAPPVAGHAVTVSVGAVTLGAGDFSVSGGLLTITRTGAHGRRHGHDRLHRRARHRDEEREYSYEGAGAVDRARHDADRRPVGLGHDRRDRAPFRAPTSRSAARRCTSRARRTHRPGFGACLGATVAVTYTGPGAARPRRARPRLRARTTPARSSRRRTRAASRCSRSGTRRSSTAAASRPTTRPPIRSSRPRPRAGSPSVTCSAPSQSCGHAGRLPLHGPRLGEPVARLRQRPRHHRAPRSPARRPSPPAAATTGSRSGTSRARRPSRPARATTRSTSAPRRASGTRRSAVGHCGRERKQVPRTSRATRTRSRPR